VAGHLRIRVLGKGLVLWDISWPWCIGTPQAHVAMTGAMEHVIALHAPAHSRRAGETRTPDLRAIVGWATPMLDSQVPQVLEYRRHFSGVRRRGTEEVLGFRIRVRGRCITLRTMDLPMVCLIVKVKEIHLIVCSLVLILSRRSKTIGSSCPSKCSALSRPQGLEVAWGMEDMHQRAVLTEDGMRGGSTVFPLDDLDTHAKIVSEILAGEIGAIKIDLPMRGDDSGSK